MAGGLFGQRLDSNKIMLEEHWYGQRFHYQGEYLTLAELNRILLDNPRASQLKATTLKHDFAQLCLLSGTFIVLYPAVAAALGQEPPMLPFLIGGAMIGVSIPLEINSRRRTRRIIQGLNGYP